jgi:hypothetical protein
MTKVHWFRRYYGIFLGGLSQRASLSTRVSSELFVDYVMLFTNRGGDTSYSERHSNDFRGFTGRDKLYSTDSGKYTSGKL